jgi:hypothetical protein
MMKLFTVLGYVTDIKGALPYMCQPDATKERAVEAWYLAACENIGVDPDAFPPASAEHETLIDAASLLRQYGIAFMGGTGVRGWVLPDGIAIKIWAVTELNDKKDLTYAEALMEIMP